MAHIHSDMRVLKKSFHMSHFNTEKGSNFMTHKSELIQINKNKINWFLTTSSH